jgi:hypothetical protein
MQLEITFSFPLKKTVVRNLCLQTETIGEVQVEGYAYPTKGGSRFDPLEEQFLIDIDSILWNGTNIRDIIHSFAEGLGDDIHQRALEEAAHHFYTQEEVSPSYSHFCREAAKSDVTLLTGSFFPAA